MSCIPKHALPMNVKHTQDESTSQLREYQDTYNVLYPTNSHCLI